MKPFSNKKATWKCSEGHTWEARISERSQGYGCPYCSNQKAFPGFNDLVTTAPELAKQAYGWDPSTLTKGSKKRVEWICLQKHIFVSSPKDRLRTEGGHRSCPVCAGRQVLVGFNDLGTTHPELAKEADGWAPETLTKNSTKKLPWICERGHKWVAGVHARVKGIGCPVCSNQRTLSGDNDLATTHPEIAKQAFGWDPTTLVAGSNKKMKWICSLGHLWTTQVSLRLRNSNCPYCGNKKLLVGFNDLASRYPQVAAQANGWDPTSLTFGSGKKMKWSCELKHEYQASVENRTRGQGCPYCSGHKCLRGFNDLATTNPTLAKQAHGWDPETVSSGSGRKLKWLCDEGHVYVAPVRQRTGGTGCAVCANKTVLVGFNDLATTHPLLASEADGWNPDTKVAGSNEKMPWKCAEGHQWSAVIASRSSGGRNCPYCSGNLVIQGVNDFATINPSLLGEVNGWNPFELAAFSDKKVSFKCEVGHEWKTSAKNRSIGRGCPSCAKFGFDPNKTAWLYFLRHDSLDLFQIGITNDPLRRIAKHKSQGWTEIDVRGPMDGALTRAIESSILSSIKKRGAVLANSTDVKKFDGWTEAWTQRSFSALSISALLDFVYEDD